MTKGSFATNGNTIICIGHFIHVHQLKLKDIFWAIRREIRLSSQLREEWAGLQICYVHVRKFFSHACSCFAFFNILCAGSYVYMFSKTAEVKTNTPYMYFKCKQITCILAFSHMGIYASWGHYLCREDW